MSNNSTSRIGSGDGNSNECQDICPQVYLDYKELKEFEGGPFGDSPPEQQNQSRRDYFIFMLENNEDSPMLSDYDDEELYDLKNDYLEKLNIVRKRLNLLELEDSESDHSSVQRGCKITEITEEEQEEEESGSTGCSTEKHFLGASGDSTRNTNIEITTIYPFSLSYINHPEQSDMFEIDYNPPKKKSCYRLKTPTPAVSDSNIPYHTKVSLHDNTFKTDKSELCFSSDTWRNAVSKFTENKETQYSARLTNLEDEDNKRNINLFPEVIIVEAPEQPSLPSIRGNSKPRSPKLKTLFSTRKSKEEFSREDSLNNERSKSLELPDSATNRPKLRMNLVEDPIEDSYETISSSLTIVESTKLPKRKKSPRKKRAKRTMWSDLKELKQQESLDVRKKYRKRYNFFTEYINHQKKRERPHSCPSTVKDPVIFGPMNLSNFTAYQPDSFYYFSTDTDWHSSKFSITTNSDTTSIRWWNKLFCCFPWGTNKNRKQ